MSPPPNSKLEVLQEALNLKAMILDIFQNHEFVEGASNIQKFISVKEDVLFFSDKNRVTIILNNLISNAIRYADTNKEDMFIEIRIEISSELVKIHFADNGVGIGEEYLDKIFNMFYRANPGSKGSGLGLFILKEAVNKLDGEVNVRSKLHVGTVFDIQIPNLVEREAVARYVEEKVGL